MKLSTSQITAATQWRAEFSGRKGTDLTEIQEILGLENGSVARVDYELDGHFALPADPSEFDPDYIEAELGPPRYLEISREQKPTLAELEMWANKMNSLVFEEDRCWYHFYVWRVDLLGDTVYFRSLHGDDGILDRFDGPFKSEKSALADAGNLELNPRP